MDERTITEYLCASSTGGATIRREMDCSFNFQQWHQIIPIYLIMLFFIDLLFHQ